MILFLKYNIFYFGFLWVSELGNSAYTNNRV